MQLVQDDCQIQNRVHSYLPHNFWSLSEYLIHYQSDDS